MNRFLWLIVCVFFWEVSRAEPPVVIRTDFPGGNAIITSNDGDTVQLEPDLRGDRPWFYWLLEAKANRAGSVRFVLPSMVIGHRNGAIGFQGPASSRDGGRTWRWMGTEQVAGNTFRIDFIEAGETVRLGVTIPYTTANLSSFLARHADNPHLKSGVLTKSSQRRDVELLQVGQRKPGRQAVLITGRHHAAETIASYVIEGMLEAAMSESEAGKEFRERFVLFCVPLVDKDGVENGDQGKNRRPHDHNRDYTDSPIYPEVHAIQQLQAVERFDYALDVHCPTLVIDIHQVMYFVGAKNHPPKNFEKVTEFAKRIKTGLPAGAPHGPLVWLRNESKMSPKNSRWFAFQEGVIMSATLEIPFAPKGKAADVESCREYGRVILQAFVDTPFMEIGGKGKREE